MRNIPIREIALEYHGDFRTSPRSIVVPDSVRVITRLHLNERSGKPVALQLGKGVERIGKEAFRSLHLDSLVIPDSVKVIEQGAFYNSHVRSLVLGTGLHTIGYGAFIGHSLSSLVIPDTVKRIGRAAFMPELSNSTSLVYLKVGRGIKEIPSAAFAGNESLVTLQLAEGLETIGTGAFANTALTQVDLPSSLKQIQK